MEDTTTSVFLKLSDLPKSEYKISKENISDFIPINATTEQNLEQAKISTEWRWRFLTINNKDIIEISQKNCDTNVRLYLNKYGEWKESNIDDFYDKYVTKILYSYSS